MIVRLCDLNFIRVKMQWVTVVLAVIVTTLFCSNQVESKPPEARILDIDKILRTLQANSHLSEDDAESKNHDHYGSLVELRENIKKPNPKDGGKTSDPTKDENYLDMDYYFDRESKKNRRSKYKYALLNKENQLLNQIEKRKNELLDQIDGISSRYNEKREKGRVVENSSAEDRNNNALLQLLDENYHPRPKSRLSPNNLLFSTVNENNEIGDNLDVLDGYSKLYVILNPQALKNPKNRKGVAQLLPKIRSINSLSLLNQQGSTRRHQARRLGKADAKEDEEQEYRPRRPRSDYGHPGGRTAIPYMNHRGDIYERDE